MAADLWTPQVCLPHDVKAPSVPGARDHKDNILLRPIGQRVLPSTHTQLVASGHRDLPFKDPELNGDHVIASAS